MVKNSSVRTRKRVKKQITDGIAHIHASLTILLLLLLTDKEML